MVKVKAIIFNLKYPFLYCLLRFIYRYSILVKTHNIGGDGGVDFSEDQQEKGDHQRKGEIHREDIP